jgi:peptidoglycan/xylan/chitin deacetylase (PgdA/CDA1 family)
MLITARTLINRLPWEMPPQRKQFAKQILDTILFPVGSIYSAREPKGLVALTFDDGPDPIITPKLLDLLRQRRQRATFFMLTGRAEKYPDIVRRIASEGHEVALHADRHDRLTGVPALELLRRLKTAHATLESIAQCKVRFFRPPFGAQSLVTYLIARWCQLDVVVWGPDFQDWIEGVPEDVAHRGLATVASGDILLMHDGIELADGEEPTFDRVRTLEAILDGLEARRLRGTTVGDLVAFGGARRRAWFYL